MRVLLIGIISFFTLPILGQDHLLQNPLNSIAQINPALISRGGNIIETTYNSQWEDYSGGYRTFYMSYVQRLPRKFNVGINTVFDRAGNTISHNNFGLVGSYELPLSRRSKLSFGAEIAFFQRRLHFENLTFGDMIDPQVGFIAPTSENLNPSINGVDLNAGLAYIIRDRLKLGYALFHVSEPNQNFTNNESKLPQKHVISILYQYKPHLYTEVVPSIYHVSQFQGGFSVSQTGVIVNYLFLGVGVGTQHFFSPTEIMGVNLHANLNLKPLRLRYTYQKAVNALAPASTHEIGLAVRFNYNYRSGLKYTGTPAF